MKILSFCLRRTSLWLSDLTVGGEWGQFLPQTIRNNLRSFWFDGLFASAVDNITSNYLSLYILSLGAAQGQIGMMSSFSNLTAAILLLPGAMLVERVGRSKEVTLYSWLLSRFSLFFLVLLPILFKGNTLIWVAILFSVVKDAFSNLGYPAWMSTSSEIVPMEGRGRYFGSRNFVMGAAGIVTTLLVGQLITVFVQPLGYQIALGLAFALGLASSACFSRINISAEHSRPATSPLSIRRLYQEVKAHPQFVALCATAAVWNVSLNIAGPFFNVYLVQNLKFTASMIGITSVASSLASLLVQRKIGALSDRWGPRRVQLWSMLLIPAVPVLWVWVSGLWDVTVLSLFTGLLWGVFNLASFNLILSFIPPNQVPRFSAVYQIVVTLSLSIGALIGSWMVTEWGFTSIFIGSGIGRLLAALLFAWIIRDSQHTRLDTAV